MIRGDISEVALEGMFTRFHMGIMQWSSRIPYVVRKGLEIWSLLTAFALFWLLLCLHFQYVHHDSCADLFVPLNSNNNNNNNSTHNNSNNNKQADILRITVERVLSYENSGQHFPTSVPPEYSPHSFVPSKTSSPSSSSHFTYHPFSFLYSFLSPHPSSSPSPSSSSSSSSLERSSDSKSDFSSKSDDASLHYFDNNLDWLYNDVFEFSFEQGFLFLSDAARVAHQVNTLNITVRSDHPCFGG